MKHYPFEYSIRVSAKAQYAKLRIKPLGKLEVVIPKRFPKKLIPDLVNQHAGWIERQLKKIPTFIKPNLPHNIHLNFDNSQHSVIYSSDGITANSDQICIKGDNYDDKINQLRHWVRQQAWQRLPSLLEVLSQQTGLAYKKMSIRSQKTRWGSCSGSGTISVNDQLLFLPQATVTYLMIHELCHTQHMNHSAKFWGLVEHHCPDFRTHERQFSQARSQIPDWFLHSLYG